MEKIELKHLAPYLPYDLQVSVKKKNDHAFHSGRICELTNKSNHGDWVKVRFDDVITIVNNNWNESSSNAHTYFISEDVIKPILRPLSDLTVKIAPRESYISKLGKIMGISDLGILQRDLSLRVVTKDQFIDMDFNSYYNAIEQLFEWHFDVFGLIEKGLAIGINTLSPSTDKTK